MVQTAEHQKVKMDQLRRMTAELCIKEILPCFVDHFIDLRVQFVTLMVLSPKQQFYLELQKIIWSMLQSVTCLHCAISETVANRIFHNYYMVKKPWTVALQHEL